MDGSSGENTRGLDLGLGPLLGVDGTLAVNGVTEGVDDTAQEFGTDGNLDNLSSSLDGISLSDEPVVTEDGDTDIVGLEVKTHSSDTRGEFHHFFGLNISQTVHTGDTIPDGYRRSAGVLTML